MRFGSVCSGIEAASVAWHPIGWKAAWLAEIEPFPCAVLAHHYPQVPNLGDMTTIARRVLTGEVEAPEVFTGGTPCQAFSVAGLRESLADARGNLSLKFVELADAIDHVRRRRGDPECVIVWENVPGVLSTKDNAFGCFLAGLAGEDDPLEPPGGRWADSGCVYGPARAVAWRTLDAQFFGLAQRRRRVFVVASARVGFDPAQVLFEWQGVRRDSAPSREAGQGTAATLDARTQGGGFPGTDGACGGHVVPAFALQHATVGGHEANGPRGKGWREDVAFTLDTVGTDVVAYAATDYESGAFDSVDAAGPLTTSADRTRAAPILAHAVALRGREGGGTAELGDDMAHALRASSGGGDKPHVLAAMQVRRLTPRECEKLQGFEPDYTLVPFGRPSKAKLDQDFLKYQLRGNPKHLKREDIDRLAADGPRYKALGNSWAVPCARWVGQRIQKVMEQANA